MKKKTLYVLAIFAVAFLFLLYIAAKKNEAALTFAPGNEVPLIIIDAGHGGMDGGAVGADGTVEKGLNLQIATKVDSLLGFMGYETLMTRTQDVSLHDSSANTIRQQKVSDIHHRMSLIEENSNSIFVSIHQNYYGDTSQHGTQVFYSKNNPSSELLAKSIQGAVTQSVQPDNLRSTKRSGTEIYLLYHAQVPAVLVECGFISNYAETQLLKDNAYQMKLSLAVVNGICNFFNSDSTEPLQEPIAPDGN